jgi:hypothetical protein
MVACLFSDVARAASAASALWVNQDQQGCISALAQKMDAETAAANVELCYRMNHWVDSSVNEKLIFEQLLLNLTNSDILSVS